MAKQKLTAGQLFGKVKLSLKSHSPEILMIAGITGGIVSTVMACKATKKVDEVLKPAKEDLDDIHETKELGEINGEEYTKIDAGRDLVTVYAKTGLDLVKLYSPALAIGVLSITSILASNEILRKRSVALAAAYATIDTSFKEYRERVAERYGDDVEKEIRYGVEKRKVTEEVEDEEGKKKKIKTPINSSEKDICSPYAKFFDESSKEWEKNPEYNLMKVRSVQNWANDKLVAQGYLFLNDVYQELDIPMTTAGQIVGWIYDPDNPESEGDNYVDFGIYETHRPNERFINGYEPVILLDFNVDGPIVETFEHHVNR